MGKHSPGPWRVSQAASHDKQYAHILPGKGSELWEPVAEIPCDDVTDEGLREVKANARLIALAPELLAALSLPIVVNALNYFAEDPAEGAGDISAEDSDAAERAVKTIEALLARAARRSGGTGR